MPLSSDAFVVPGAEPKHSILELNFHVPLSPVLFSFLLVPTAVSALAHPDQRYSRKDHCKKSNMSKDTLVILSSYTHQPPPRLKLQSLVWYTSSST